MKRKYQVTMYCTSGQYKPVSTIVNWEQTDEQDLTKDKETKREIITKGVQQICVKRYWTKRDIVNNSYTKAKVRVVE